MARAVVEVSLFMEVHCVTNFQNGVSKAFFEVTQSQNHVTVVAGPPCIESESARN